MIPSNRSAFFRRLRFYIFGLLMGCVLVGIITDWKACQMPSTLKLQELDYQHRQFTDQARCQMECRKITEADVAYVLKNGGVKYGESSVHAKPWPNYAVEGSTVDGKELRIMIDDRDTISVVVTTLDLGMKKDTCICN